MMSYNNLKRHKRAYISYMSDLLHKQKEGIELFDDGNSVDQEIIVVERYISDLDFKIRTSENDETG